MIKRKRLTIIERLTIALEVYKGKRLLREIALEFGVSVSFVSTCASNIHSLFACVCAETPEFIHIEQPKRGRGRPKKRPLPEPIASKRKPGRPRKIA